jgi:hypothetical protein
LATADWPTFLVAKHWREVNGVSDNNPHFSWYQTKRKSRSRGFSNLLFLWE